MAQKLIQPINDMKVNASYKWGSAYPNEFGDTHYGQDLISGVGSTTIYAQGNGVVDFAGYDNVCGNVVGIVYDDAYNYFENKSYPIGARYQHLASIKVKPGQRVTKDTVIGVMGKTGVLVTGVHLHLELDKDIKNLRYTPTLTKDSNILKAGWRGSKDTTVDPMRMMYTKVSAPDNQKVAVNQDRSWVDPRDAQLPQIK